MHFLICMEIRRVRLQVDPMHFLDQRKFAIKIKGITFAITNDHFHNNMAGGICVSISFKSR